MAKEYFRRDDNYIPVVGGVTDDTTQETKQLRVDPTTLRLKVDSNSNDGTATTGTDVLTITTAGTAIVLPTHACRRCFIQAYEGNTGTIVIGDANVVAAATTRRGLALFATQGEWFNVSNTNLLYADTTVSGEKISIYYEV